MFSEYNTFLFRPRVFSPALGCRASGGHAYTPWCKCGSRPGSVARVLGVHSRQIWQVTTGSLCEQLEPTRLMQTPEMASLFSSLCPLLFLKYHSSRQRLGRHGTTAALQDFSLRDSHERRCCVRDPELACVRMCRCRILQQ